jgi:hypothetical protein
VWGGRTASTALGGRGRDHFKALKTYSHKRQNLQNNKHKCHGGGEMTEWEITDMIEDSPTWQAGNLNTTRARK